LTRQSESVALLAALDPSSVARGVALHSPPPKTSAADGVVAESRRHLRSLAALTASERFAYIRARALPKVAAWLRWHLLVAWLTRLTYRFQLAMGHPLPVFVRSLYIQDIYVDAIARYTPRPYAGSVLLFRGPDRVSRGPMDWEQLIDPGSEVCVIPAGHLEMREERSFRVWAEKLATALDRAQRRRPLDVTAGASTATR
jgi:hypothetical protein